MYSNQSVYNRYNFMSMTLCGFNGRFKFKRLQLISSGFNTTKFAIMKTSKHGSTVLCIPGHDPPSDLTISMDIHPNPGPIMPNTDPAQYLNSTSTVGSSSLNLSSLQSLSTSWSTSYLDVGSPSTPLVNFSSSMPSSMFSMHRVYRNSTAVTDSNLTHPSVPKLTYSRSDLLQLRRKSQSIYSCSDFCSPVLKELNIFRYRSKRAGKRSRSCHSTPLMTGLHHTSQTPKNIKTTSQTPTDPVGNGLKFCLLNARSINNKSLQIKDYIVERNIDVFALTETWLKNSADSDFAIRDVCPSGYLILHVPRKNRSGGGVAIVYSNNLKIKLCHSTSHDSFELMELTLHSSANIFRIVVVYRPPSSSYNQFFVDFSSFLERLMISPGKLLICGDFNLHVDNKNDKFAVRFLELLDCCCLRVFDSVTPTHKNNHALDLVITQCEENFVSNYFVHDPVLSDHFAVHCTLSVVKPPVQLCTRSFRKIRSIDLDSFRRDIANSSLCQSPASNLSDLCLQYDTVLLGILNKHAPLRNKSFSVRPKAPWYTDEIRCNKTKRRNLERRWRRSKLTVDRELYVAQSNVVKKLIFQAKMNYYSKLITDAGSNSNDLFRSINRLLHRTPEKKLPTSTSPTDLASNFVHFFKNKIVNIRNGFISTSHLPNDFSYLDSPKLDCQLDSFLSISIDDLSTIARKMSSKSCSLDPLPASLLLGQFGVLLPTICKIVNLSLQTGVVPSSLKVAVLKPLLKKSSLNHEVLGNYRPISNLKNVSKIIGKVVSLQLNDYLSLNNLHEPLQSAYKTFHSCETALLRVQNDILHSIDNRSCVAMLLLDLSAAFDTVDHQILLNRLNTKFGISGIALQWFKSYLTDRFQFVSIDDFSSEALQLDCGVPQGSVLGPLLYLLYTSPVADILRQHRMSFHLYADDTQLYIPFSCNDDLSLNDSMKLIENCLSDIDAWMTTNKLKLNKDKTEFLLFSSKHSPQLSLPSLQFGSDVITPSTHARNIGVIFDTHLTMVRHVNSICKSSFYHLRNIAKIRKYISLKTTEILVHSFVSSKLDNCNSLLFGLPNKLLATNYNLYRMLLQESSLFPINTTTLHLSLLICTGYQLNQELNIKSFYLPSKLFKTYLQSISRNSFQYINQTVIFVLHHKFFYQHSPIISNHMVIAPSL